MGRPKVTEARMKIQALINEATAQIIDASGKCRALIYPEGLAVILPYPIQPLTVKRELVTKPVPLSRAREWAKVHSLEVVAQTLSRGKIEYLHVKPSRYHVLFPRLYIQVKPDGVAKLPGVPEEPFHGQLASKETSQINSYRDHRRIANVLQAYALFTYSRDPDSWGPESFVLMGSTEEIDDWGDLLTVGEESHNSLDPNNQGIYADGKIRVPSEVVRDKLLEYVYTQTVKNPYISKVKDLSLVPGSYESIGDFTPRQNQIIFTNRAGLVKWCRNPSTDRHQAYEKVTPELIAGYNPFFLRDPTIDPLPPHIFLVQPVYQQEKARAVAVSAFWIKTRKNSVTTQGQITYMAPPAKTELVNRAHVREQGVAEEPQRQTPTVLKISPEGYLALLYLRS